MNVSDQGIKAKNVTAPGSAVELKGGKYMLIASGTWNTTGTVGIDALSADGSTWCPVVMYTSDGGSLTAIKGANGTAVMDLAPGQYRLNVATVTAVYASLTRVPY